MITSALRMAVLLALLAQAAIAENLVLLGGTVIDGSGRARARANVRIRDGRITDVGAFRPARGEATLDVTGLIVAPGFIDLHNHSTTVLEDNLDALSLITQGITTIAVGLDGEGPFEVEGFMSRFDEEAPAVNLAAYAGHSTIRRQVLGFNFARPATEDEIAEMEKFAEMGMREGAYGLSTSLSSGPSSSATTGEILALARVVARYGGSLVCELRNEGDGLVEAVKEVIEIGRQAKVPVQISRLRLQSAAQGKVALALAEIDRARTQGVDIAIDINGYAEAPGDPASEKDVRDLLRHAWVLVASDGRIGDSHPRGTGAFPRVVAQFVQTEKALTLETAIRKMTGLPAARLGLRQRGLLQRTAAADIVVFDPATLKDASTIENPGALALGMKHVFVNGMMVIKDGAPTDARPGQALR